MNTRTGTQAAQAEVTDFPFLGLVHSRGIFNLSWIHFQCFTRSRKAPGGRSYCCSMRWFRRCSKPQPGKEVTWALTSSTSWPFHFSCESASRASASWTHAESLTHIQRGQSIFGWSCYFLKMLHSSINTPKPYLFCSPHRLVLASCSTVRGLAATGWKPCGCRSLSGRIRQWQNFERVQQTTLNVAIKPATVQLNNIDFLGEKYDNSPPFLNLYSVLKCTQQFSFTEKD